MTGTDKQRRGADERRGGAAVWSRALAAVLVYWLAACSSSSSTVEDVTFRESGVVVELPYRSTHLLEAAGQPAQSAGCSVTAQLYGPLVPQTPAATALGGGTLRLLSDADRQFLEEIRRERQTQPLTQAPDAQAFLDRFERSALEKELEGDVAQATALCLGYLANAYRADGARFREWTEVFETRKQPAFMQKATRELFMIVRAGRGRPPGEAHRAARSLTEVSIAGEPAEHACLGWTAGFVDDSTAGNRGYRTTYRWDFCALEAGIFVYDLMNETRPRLWPPEPPPGDSDVEPWSPGGSWTDFLWGGEGGSGGSGGSGGADAAGSGAGGGASGSGNGGTGADDLDAAAEVGSKAARTGNTGKDLDDLL